MLENLQRHGRMNALVSGRHCMRRSASLKCSLNIPNHYSSAQYQSRTYDMEIIV